MEEDGCRGDEPKCVSAQERRADGQTVGEVVSKVSCQVQVTGDFDVRCRSFRDCLGFCRQTFYAVIFVYLHTQAVRHHQEMQQKFKTKHRREQTK